MLTCFQLVWMSAERGPGQLAIVDDLTDRALTYAELIEEIEIVAAGLKEHGIGRGSRVATVLPGLFDHAIALLALQRLGAVPALLNFRLPPADIAGLIKDGGMAGAIIQSDPDLSGAVGAVLPDGSPLMAIGDLADGTIPFTECRGEATSLGPLPDLDPEDPAFIFYTSGTTGLPKGVVLAQRTTEHRILWLSTQAGVRHGQHLRTLGFMPLSHAIGFYGVFLVTLAYNGTYIVQSAFNPVQANELMAERGITYTFAVPQLYYAMTQAHNYDPKAFSGMELALYGGGEITPELLEQMDAEWGGTVRHIYGTTETMCSLYNPDPVGQHIRLRPGFYSRTRVVTIDGEPDDLVKPGEEGELIVDATVDTIFSEYLNRPDATAEKVRDGWYYTGDVCLFHADGDVDLIGRADDMIRSGGENIHPGEIESLLLKHQCVADCAVVGVGDPKWGQRAVACVVAAGEVDGTQLDDYLKGSDLAGYKRPKEYVLMENLPRNAANKVLRRDLQKQLAEN